MAKRRIDERGNRVVDWGHKGVVVVYYDEISPLAHLDRADLAFQANGPGTVDCRHFKDLLRRHDSRIAEYTLGHQSGKLERLNERMIVAAGRTIRSQSNGNPRHQHIRNRRESRRQVEIAAGIVRD